MLKTAQGHVVTSAAAARSIAGRRLHHRRFGERAMGNFSKGPVAARQEGWRHVNVIHPGATVTERFHELIEMRVKSSGKSAEELRAEATKKDGIRRLGQPEDISALTLFLCSEKSRHIQGTAIAVDGGATAGYY